MIGLWYKVDMEKILKENANRSLNVTGKSDISIKKMARVLNYDCKKVIFDMAMDQKVVEFTQNIAAKKIQKWWRLATGYRIILNKIMDAYQRDEIESLDCLNLDLNFLRFVGSPMHFDDYIYQQAVHWYLQHNHPCVFCKEFIDIFYDVEQEEEDYDYIDWKTSRKWLIFAKYIRTCGGMDEWNWLKVFSGIMLERGEEELFSCDTWLSYEVVIDELTPFQQRQIVYMTNGFSPTLKLMKGGRYDDICIKNYFLLAEVLKSGENMNFSDLQTLLYYFVIAPNRKNTIWLKDNAWVIQCIENWREFEQHIIEELCYLVSSSLNEGFRTALAEELLSLVFKISKYQVQDCNEYENYRFIPLICESILKGRFTKKMLYDNVMVFGNIMQFIGITRLTMKILNLLEVIKIDDGHLMPV